MNPVNLSQTRSPADFLVYLQFPIVACATGSGNAQLQTDSHSPLVVTIVLRIHHSLVVNNVKYKTCIRLYTLVYSITRLIRCALVKT